MMRALLQGAGAEGGEGNGGSSSNNNNNNNKMNDLLASMPGMQKAMEEMLLNGGEGAVGGDEQGGSSNLAGMMAALEAIGSAAGAGSEVGKWGCESLPVIFRPYIHHTMFRSVSSFSFFFVILFRT